MNKRVTALILAAGSSSRLGHPKQLLPWKNKTLLGHTIAIAHESKAAGVRVVLGSRAQSIRAALSDTTTEFLINNNWEEGMGASISCGVDHLLAEKKVADGILIMLCDQPLIDSNFLNVLIDAYTENEYGIVGTLYGKDIGVPVIFDRSYFPKLSGLKGEGGRTFNSAGKQPRLPGVCCACQQPRYRYRSGLPQAVERAGFLNLKILGVQNMAEMPLLVMPLEAG